MAMSNRERQAKWRERARAAMRDTGDKHADLFAEEVERRALQLRAHENLSDFAATAKEFYLACLKRHAQIGEEIVRNGWDEERAHDASQVQQASEEALIDLAAAEEVEKDRTK